MKARVKWEMFPNQNIAHLHVDVRLWDSIIAKCYEIEVTTEQRALLDSLTAIHGVIEIGVDSYNLRITKATVFGWDEIKPRVESVFAEWANSELVEVGS